jgi:tRNA threonylcarbamoyl adenosine modification protein YeaZ
MLILAIDTASSLCSAAVHDTVSGQMRAARSENLGTGHAEHLMPMIEAVLAGAGADLAGIGAVACSIGPGSFTGVRVGVAAARGLMQALSIPGLPVTTLEALALDALALHAGPVRVLIDARRGEVHAQDFDAEGAPLGPPALLGLAEAAQGAERFMLAGSGAPLAAPGRPCLLETASTGTIGAFCRRAAMQAPQSQTSLTMSPLYLRGADAKPQQGFALPRASGLTVG